VWLTGKGAARIVEWSPNHAVVDVEGAEPGSVLVYNMNFDEGWRSDAGRVFAQDNAVAVRLEAGSRRVTFRYPPPHPGLGVRCAPLGVGALVGLRRRERAEG